MLISWGTEDKTSQLKDNGGWQLVCQSVSLPGSQHAHSGRQLLFTWHFRVLLILCKEQTLSSRFCQLSSRLTISSMQWDKVERIPAVVALKVMASPLKSIPLIPLGLAGGNTGADTNNKQKDCSQLPRDFKWISDYVFAHIFANGVKNVTENSHFSLLPLLLWLYSPSGLVVVGKSSSSSSTIGKKTAATWDPSTIHIITVQSGIN